MPRRQLGMILGEIHVGLIEIAVRVPGDALALADQRRQTVRAHEALQDGAAVLRERPPCGVDHGVACRSRHVDRVALQGHHGRRVGTQRSRIGLHGLHANIFSGRFCALGRGPVCVAPGLPRDTGAPDRHAGAQCHEEVPA